MSGAKPIAISDSANFYISAERIFDPTLRGVPVIVLSNNDGCAIARSDEAKSLGIKMGQPLHLIRDKIERHGIRVFSSNYTLYGDISRRVVAVYEGYTPHVEVYSIDECFLDFSCFGHRGRDREHYAREMRSRVLRRVGVPVRVGIAPTKTLAKCANDIAKKNPICSGVLDAMDPRICAWMLRACSGGRSVGCGASPEAETQRDQHSYGGPATGHAHASGADDRHGRVGAPRARTARRTLHRHGIGRTATKGNGGNPQCRYADDGLRHGDGSDDRTRHPLCGEASSARTGRRYVHGVLPYQQAQADGTTAQCQPQHPIDGYVQ